MDEKKLVGMNYNNKTINSNSWMIDIDGEYSNIIKKYLINDNIPENSVNEIISNAAKILNFCPCPAIEENKKITGLVIGKVQSGKTSNFIALTSLAFDNGYTHVILLGGTKTILADQNSERLHDYFGEDSEVAILNTCRSDIKNSDVVKLIKNKKKVVIVALKSTKQLEMLSDDIFTNSFLLDKPVIIIDDEGDEASLNTLVKSGKKSAIYNKIENLRNKLKRHCFISVTATPQANLLIDSIDVLSPDFGVLINPGIGYCGLNTFHTVGSPYVVEIDNIDNIDKDNNEEKTNELLLKDGGSPESFKEALLDFFVACGIYNLREGGKKSAKLSMLIHPSVLQDVHAIVEKKTQGVIDEWNKISEDLDDVAYTSLKMKLKSAYDRYKVTVGDKIPDFKDVEKQSIEAMRNNYNINILNQNHEVNDLHKNFKYNIYIGGNLLGRGLTIKGLAVTYIIRTPKGEANVDTVEQRARWFGYKTKYLDLCRVYAPKKILKELRNIREHEEDVWNTVQEENMNGTRFKDIVRIFTLSDGLRMTRTSVASTKKYVYKKWSQQKMVLNDKDNIKSNKDIIEKFRKKHSESLKSKTFGKGNPYVMIENLKFKEVYNDLLLKLIFNDEERGLNISIISKLEELFKTKGLDPLIDVIWMRDGGESKHEIVDSEIGNYMEGKNDAYKGDMYQFVTHDKMQLQIHNIKDKHNDARPSCPVITLYIPKDCIEKLTNLVIRK